MIADINTKFYAPSEGWSKKTIHDQLIRNVSAGWEKEIEFKPADIDDVTAQQFADRADELRYLFAGCDHKDYVNEMLELNELLITTVRARIKYNNRPKQ